MKEREALKLALEALEYAEAGLADIGDANREPGDDLAWCERRAAQSLPKIRQTITAIKEALAQPAQHYESGWNSALEMVAYQIENNFKQAFGGDTLKSISVYIKGFKK